MVLRKVACVCLCFALTLAACDKRTGFDVLGPQKTSGAIAMTVKCLEPVSDGTCNKKTCKQDAKSDCADFGAACIKSDHKYEGTKEDGTCTRVKINI